jgi:hypothetical protein
MTKEELAALPPVLNVTTAARVLDIGRSLAYELVRTGNWPTPVLHVGRLIKIPTAPLLRLLEAGGENRGEDLPRSSTDSAHETTSRP